MDLAGYIAAIPTVTEMSQRSRILLVAYLLRREGQTEITRSTLDAAFLAAELSSPPGLGKALDKLAKGNNAPILKVSDARYALSVDGAQEVENYLDSVAGIRPARASLARLVPRLSDPDERAFLAEAIACLQVNAKRSAVVMCWLLAVNHMEQYVLTHVLAEFNSALALRPDCKGVSIQKKDDFTLIKKEFIFVEVLKSANIITGDVRKIMETSLGFRNSCAHPAMITIPDAKVIGTIEDLVDNIILRYPI